MQQSRVMPIQPHKVQSEYVYLILSPSCRLIFQTSWLIFQRFGGHIGRMFWSVQPCVRWWTFQRYKTCANTWGRLFTTATPSMKACTGVSTGKPEEHWLKLQVLDLVYCNRFTIYGYMIRYVYLHIQYIGIQQDLSIHNCLMKIYANICRKLPCSTVNIRVSTVCSPLN